MSHLWRPAEAFVGDCMPFWHGGRFHLYYLWDVGHHVHPRVGGRGGHEWAHRSSADLINWTDHPLALPLDFDAGEWSNCTGSFLADGDAVRAYYALRHAAFPDEERFRRAVSRDGGISFTTCPPGRPDASPDGFDGNFRDPCVWRGPDGRYHLLMSSRRADGTGALLHYRADGPDAWPDAPDVWLEAGDVPECPDLFAWNGFHYLFYSVDAVTHYRYARAPSLDWVAPPRDTPFCARMQVVKTAAFGDRRLAVGFVGTWADGRVQYGGRAVFRELVQHPDGALSTAAVPEMAPAGVPRPVPAELDLPPGGEAAIALPGGAWRWSACVAGPASGALTATIENDRGETVRTARFDGPGRRLDLDGGRSVSLPAPPTGGAPARITLALSDDVLEASVDEAGHAVSPGDPVPGGRLRLRADAGRVRLAGVQLLAW